LSVGKRDMCVDREFGLETAVQKCQRKGNRTHLKDMENSVELQFPGCNLLFVVPRMEETGSPVALALFRDLALDAGHRSVVKRRVVGQPSESCMIC